MCIKQRSTPVITCYFCGKSGHLQRNCPEKRQQFGSDREVDRDADRANAQNQPKKNVYYVPSTSDELCKYAKIIVNDKYVCALVDTGESVTVLSEEFYRMCNSPTLLNVSNDIKFVGAGGEPLIMLGKTEVSNAIGDCRVPFDVYVCKNLTEPFILGLDFLQKLQCVVDYKQKILKAGDVTLHLTKRFSPPSSFDAILVNTLKLPPFTEMMVPCKIIGHEFNDGSHVHVERNEALLGKYEIMCRNGVTKTFGNSVLVRMANFTPTAKCLPMGVIVAKIGGSGEISIFAEDSCVDDCAYILETVPMIQDHSFEALRNEDADLLLLWEELKLNELNLNEGEKKQCMKLLKSTKKLFYCQKPIWVELK